MKPEFGDTPYHEIPEGTILPPPNGISKFSHLVTKVDAEGKLYTRWEWKYPLWKRILYRVMRKKI